MGSRQISVWAKHRSQRQKAVAAVTAASLLAPVLTAATEGAAWAMSPVTITAQLPPLSGPISSPENADLRQFTATYERSHPGVKVSWIENTFPDVTSANAALVTRASGGNDPDIVWEQYTSVNSGTIPAGIIANLTPYLHKKDPYDTQYKNWLDTWEPVDLPFMHNAAGVYDVILSSDVATGLFYNKSVWAKAGISGTPKTYAALLTDFARLKKIGAQPFLFASGGINCNPSWWERELTTTLLEPQIAKIDVDHAAVLTGRDIALGVANGTFSMKNPKYAEVWKLLLDLKPYLAAGGINYGACATPTATTPPLSPESLLLKGKVATLWGGSWWGPQLDSQGGTGKWGVFPFPEVTKATVPWAPDVNAGNTVGGPNGDGEWSITTQKADSSMTSAKTGVVVNFLEYLTSPKVLSKWLVGEQGGPAFIPLVKGATLPPGAQTLETLIAPGPTVNGEGLLDDALTPTGSDSGGRLVQELLSGSLSLNAFGSQWDAIYKQAAQQWASTNKVSIPGLGG